MALDDRLEIGSIIFEKVFDTKPPKDKYYIVTGFTTDTTILCTVYINTTININLFPTQRLKNLHVPISASDNPFLKYDSFVDCSNLHQKATNMVMSVINNGTGRYGYVSNVSTATLTEIMDTIKYAHTIPPITKKKFGFI